MMRCLIIDDEPLARELLESYLVKIEELKLVKSCSNALEAFTFLQEKPVDLIFLDIEMPQVSGIELLRSLKNKPAVILTTAYREYAFEAYDLDVIDYMLKPINFDRFLRGIGKIKQLKPYDSPGEVDIPNSSFEEAYLYMKENREMKKVYLKDILYIESLRDYVRVKMINKELITYQKISYLEQKRPQQKFIRIHRSFMVALDKIRAFSQNNVRINNVDLPIGRNYKQAVLKILTQSSVFQ
jgi:DNA-binding LytR/AlgR family response regulator